MKQIITKHDLKLIVGKFIIEINSDESTLKLTDENVNIDFYLEKRVRWISFGGDGIIKSDLYGGSLTITEDRFVEWFNEYIGTTKGERFHRLLYSTELDIVFDFIKSRNY